MACVLLKLFKMGAFYGTDSNIEVGHYSSPRFVLSIYLPSLTARTCILLSSWSDGAKVLKLSLPCINVSVKPYIFFSFSCCFLQTTQNIFSLSENCSQFLFSFYFLIVLGFCRELVLEFMMCFIIESHFTLNVNKEVKLFFSSR